MSRQPTPNVLDMVLGPVEMELSPLTTWESGRLAHLEGVIEAGLQTFYDVGGALMEIREGRLYRQTHRSFEAYTKERWGMGKSRAHQLIEAASTVAAISGPVEEGDPSTIVDTLPTNEAQVRPLAGLDDQAKREVWAEAVATAPAGKVTGRHVAQVAQKGRGARGEEEETDPWVAAANKVGSRQKRAEALAVAITPWIVDYRDKYGRDWRGIAERGDPAHTNSVLWDDINKEANGRRVQIDAITFKEAIKQAFSWLVAQDRQRAEMGIDRAPAIDELGREDITWDLAPWLRDAGWKQYRRQDGTIAAHHPTLGFLVDKVCGGVVSMHARMRVLTQSGLDDVDEMDGGGPVVDVQPDPKPSTIVDTLPGRDGRIERAQRLIDQCRAVTGRAFEDEYTALVGTPSDLLAVGRALDGIVAKLEHLQGTLQGEPEVETWGEL